MAGDVTVSLRALFVATSFAVASACTGSGTAPTVDTATTGASGTVCGRGTLTSAALVGDWIRGADTAAVQHGCALVGAWMVVHWDGNVGTVASANARCDFSVGQVKWRNLNVNACSIEDLQVDNGVGPTRGGGNPFFQTHRIGITKPNERQIIEIDGNGSYADNPSSTNITYTKCGPGTGISCP